MPLSPARAATLLADNVQRVIQGKPDVVRLATSPCSPRGTCCWRTCPATARPRLARAIAAASAAGGAASSSPRTCCPRDVTGVTIFDQGDRQFEFHPGGRSSPTSCSPTRSTAASPKTQSALLEVMEERTVTVDGVPHAGAAAVPRGRHPEPDRAWTAPTGCPRPSSTGS